MSYSQVFDLIAMEVCLKARDVVCFPSNDEAALLWATTICQVESGEPPLKSVRKMPEYKIY